MGHVDIILWDLSLVKMEKLNLLAVACIGPAEIFVKCLKSSFGISYNPHGFGFEFFSLELFLSFS